MRPFGLPHLRKESTVHARLRGQVACCAVGGNQNRDGLVTTRLEARFPP
jgi:hypothetical protein